MLTIRNRPPQPAPRDAYGAPLRSAPVQAAPFQCHEHGRDAVPYGDGPVQTIATDGREICPRCAPVLVHAGVETLSAERPDGHAAGLYDHLARARDAGARERADVFIAGLRAALDDPRYLTEILTTLARHVSHV